MAKSLSRDERLWRAEADADTMARYEEIMGDAKRRAAAIAAAKKQVSDLTKRAAAMSKAAGIKRK